MLWLGFFFSNRYPQACTCIFISIIRSHATFMKRKRQKCQICELLEEERSNWNHGFEIRRWKYLSSLCEICHRLHGSNREHPTLSIEIVVNIEGLTQITSLDGLSRNSNHEIDTLVASKFPETLVTALSMYLSFPSIRTSSKPPISSQKFSTTVSSLSKLSNFLQPSDF